MNGDSNHTKGNTMTEYNEGDLVEAVKGNTAIRGPLVNIWGLGRSLCLKLSLGLLTDIIYLEANGYKITVIEKAPPKVVLPTEPGVYADRANDTWVLNGRLQWMCPESPGDNDNAAAYAPFTPLKPVSETAKKVLEYLEDSAVIDVRDSRCAGVRARFGVEL